MFLDCIRLTMCLLCCPPSLMYLQRTHSDDMIQNFSLAAVNLRSVIKVCE